MHPHWHSQNANFLLIKSHTERETACHILTFATASAATMRRGIRLTTAAFSSQEIRFSRRLTRVPFLADAAGTRTDANAGAVEHNIYRAEPRDRMAQHAFERARMDVYRVTARVLQLVTHYRWVLSIFVHSSR